MNDSFKTKTRLKVGSQSYTIYSLKALEKKFPKIKKAPVLAPDPPREPPALRGRPHRPQGGHRGPRNARP